MVEELRITQLSKTHIRLLFEIGRKPETTSKTQTVYTPFMFYVNSGFLKKLGLITDVPYDDTSLLKLWVTTEKGDKVLHHLKSIEQFLCENGGENNVKKNR
jgi:hypothetical protein